MPKASVIAATAGWADAQLSLITHEIASGLTSFPASLALHPDGNQEI